MRRLIADTIALVVFCTVAAGLVEVLVVGLSGDQLLYTRLAAIPAIVLTARPYGMWRDMIFRRFGVRDGDQTRATFFDTLAFVSFQGPVYALILLFAGASAGQIVLAIPAAAAAMVLAGRPYGIFLDWVRRMCGVVVLPAAAGRADD
ncbi:MAG: L-alanine exporter AlaE [Rhizobiaceae bacterium]|nr:L-alanine exporter AlaE [Rhizobiaceae bacterium]